ncbi:MAG TPA: hypothetical protein VM677_15930 [Actinokineospora sp.]|jgi:hypothetical protein|nr:hypothetical protein [Actinokineospora sp.]
MGDTSWIFDLIAPDDAVRERALRCNREAVEHATEAQHWINWVWHMARTPVPTDPKLAAEMDQARAAHRWFTNQSIYGQLGRFCDDDPLVRELYGPFVLLFLEWESRYPDQWRTAGSYSPWGSKEGLLANLTRWGVPEGIRPGLRDLVIVVLRRPYRCKDWMFAPLVRRLADDAFLVRIRELLADPDPLTRLRAEFVLHVVADPEIPVRRKTWVRWLAVDPQRP